MNLLPEICEVKVLPYMTVNPEKSMQYVPSLTKDGDIFNEFAKECRLGGQGRNYMWSVKSSKRGRSKSMSVLLTKRQVLPGLGLDKAVVCKAIFVSIPTQLN